MISRRRGLYSTTWSDNAKTFKRADRESSVNKKLWDKIDLEELQAKLTSRKSN